MPPLLGSRMQPADTHRGSADAPPPTTMQTLGAGVRVGMSDAPVPKDLVVSNDYFSLMGSVGELNGKSLGDYRPWGKTLNQFVPFSSHLDVYDLDAVWSDIAEIKRRDPNALPGVTTREAWEKGKVQGSAGLQSARVAVSRGPRAAAFAGQVVGGLADPSAYLGFGGAAKSLIGAATRAAVENAGIELLQEGLKRDQAVMAGETRDFGDLVWDVGAAAGTGGIIGGGVHTIADNWSSIKAAPKAVQEKVWAQMIAHAPEPLRERLGGKIDWDALDDVVPDIAEGLIGRDNLSIEEKGAIDTIRREGTIDAASPFRPDGAGSEAHRAAVIRNIERLSDEITGLSRPRTVAAAAGGDTALSSGTVAVPGRPGQVGYANDVYQFFRAKGVPDQTARGIAAGVHAESASNHNVRGGYKGRAVGLGQWLGERRAKLLARYGPTPTRRQQLDFMWEELQGGDPGGRAVLAAGDERAVLDAYIRKFMRPAPGSQTTGDLRRGMQALGRGGETIRVDDAVPAQAANDGVDPEAAVRAELADREAAIEADRGQLEAQRAGDVDEDLDFEASRNAGQRDLFDVAPMPTLQRELFPDDTSWRIAQSAYEAETMGLAEPAITRQSVWIDARDELIEAKGGDVPGALYHPDVGPIDVKWGEAPAGAKQGFGLAKIVDKHPEVLDDLPAILGDMSVTSRTANRIQLESADHKAAVRLEWDGKEQTWLLTAFRKDGNAPPQRRTDVPGRDARDGSPTREAAGDIAENGGAGNAGARAVRDAAAGDVPMARLWGDPAAPRDAGGLTAAERASLDYDEPGLKDFVDPAGEGNRLDLDGSVHDLRAAIDAADPLAGVAFATRDGIDETPADALAAIDAEEKALAALRACL